MTLGGNYDNNQSRIDRLLAEADAGRAAKAAKAAIGYKSLLRRLRDRVRPGGSDPGANPDTAARPGR
jgi:hypothetical protein